MSTTKKSGSRSAHKSKAAELDKPSIPFVIRPTEEATAPPAGAEAARTSELTTSTDDEAAPTQGPASIAGEHPSEQFLTGRQTRKAVSCRWDWRRSFKTRHWPK